MEWKGVVAIPITLILHTLNMFTGARFAKYFYNIWQRIEKWKVS